MFPTTHAPAATRRHTASSPFPCHDNRICCIPNAAPKIPICFCTKAVSQSRSHLPSGRPLGARGAWKAAEEMGFRVLPCFFPTIPGPGQWHSEPRLLFWPRQPATSCARKPRVASRDGIGNHNTHTTRTDTRPLCLGQRFTDVYLTSPPPSPLSLPIGV